MTRLLSCLLALLLALSGASAQTAGDELVVQAREALRKKDRAALAAARQAAAGHPLAMWVDYWEIGNRLADARQSELDAFYARWPGSYVEDRLRNDWLLELGKRRDWANLRIEYPRFGMNDDREVSCYSLVAQHLQGDGDALALKREARAAWLAPSLPDDGCQLLAKTLVDARVFGADEVFAALRQAVEHNRQRTARQAAALLSSSAAQTVDEIIDQPQRFLQRRAAPAAHASEWQLLALLRLAANDPDHAAGQLEGPWASRLPATMTATAWAHVAKQAALKGQPQAAEHARRAWRLWDRAHAGVHLAHPPWSDDLLAWHARAALREGGNDARRWTLLQRAVDAMSVAERKDATWVYWKARAALSLARSDDEGAAERAAALQALESIAAPVTFYGQLATEDLGRRVLLPDAPLPLTPAERDAPHGLPGLQRALHLVAIGLRNEGVREWNFTLRGMNGRELLAAAQLACDREVWDRCINTSERARTEVDVAQRYPLPWRDEFQAAAHTAGIDASVVYGLIRQESRFIADVRSHVGASGLMQLMPATARWTARKIGLDYRPEMINDRAVNLQLGAAYFKRVLDDFGGSLALAAAAYNAGPGRPRRWREGPTVEAAAWAETIPFNETRDYVKKVLSNSVTYAALLGAPQVSLKQRLGPAVGPRDPSAAAPDTQLP